METIDLAVIVVGSVATCWKFPALRWLALMLCLGVAVLPVANGLPIPDRAFISIPLDLAGGVAGMFIWLQFKERAGLVFFVSSLAACVAHLAMFMSDHDRWTNNLYVGLLNGLFIATCLIIGGTGFARHHRHLGGGKRTDHARRFVGSGS